MGPGGARAGMRRIRLVAVLLFGSRRSEGDCGTSAETVSGLLRPEQILQKVKARHWQTHGSMLSSMGVLSTPVSFRGRPPLPRFLFKSGASDSLSMTGCGTSSIGGFFAALFGFAPLRSCCCPSGSSSAVFPLGRSGLISCGTTGDAAEKTNEK